MKILPLTNSYKPFNKINNTQTRFERKSEVTPENHQYTGNVSVDLAYASMFDSAIANDLKLMGLI